MAMEFEDFEPIFCEPQVEFSAQSSFPLPQFLLHAYAPVSSHLVIHVTDFHSDTWEAPLSVSRLEDIRDITGIGGSWSEFLDYFITSIKSADLKLVLERSSDFDGVSHGKAKLVAQKSKGMPVISIALNKLADSAAKEAMSNLSLRLFKAFKSINNSLKEEKERNAQLTKAIAAEKERNESIQQLEQRQKFQKISVSEKADVSTNGLQNSPEKQATQDTVSTKVKNRVVPAHRRTKVRGAQLCDHDDS
ncbi:uncharacterized protein LOC129309114 [Prosopis cineraria]|uniref:uncharacterized protein LOC129309114 n=1 Tax=Prosopis cineraria TaxID=364024 RepID=UPI002410194C|nr:uncharacterized protein LOC129309114 [Prosopis cineraria]XP_054806475.1 uncharacterized protein LOC129309114 [Prosopis cineraria]